LEEAFESWLFEDSLPDSLEDFFARLDVSVKDIREFLPETFDNGKTMPDKAKIKQLLFSDGILSAVLSKSLRSRKNVHAYLRQEGLADRKRWGFVDLSWRGRMQRKLSRFVKEIGGVPPTGLYFALASRPSSDEYGEYLEFRKFEERPEIFPRVLEILCSGSHGVVVGYHRDRAGGMTPRLKKLENDAFCRWGMRCYRKASMTFCDHLAAQFIDMSKWDFGNDMIIHLLDAFWLHPSQMEATVWGEFEFSSDATERTSFTVAGRVRWRNFIGELLPRGNPYRLNVFWLKGTVMSSPKPLGRVFLIFHRCVVFAKRFILRLRARR
jgi:hypothetical protein